MGYCDEAVCRVKDKVDVETQLLRYGSPELLLQTGPDARGLTGLLGSKKLSLVERKEHRRYKKTSESCKEVPMSLSLEKERRQDNKCQHSQVCRAFSKIAIPQ